MTKFVTAEQCLAAIQGDSAWRKKEISFLKNRVARSEGASKDMMMRAGILMLYAHWEGFVRFGAETYIAHINERVSRFNPPLTEHYSRLLMWRCVQKKGQYPHEKYPHAFLDIMTDWKSNPEKLLPENMIDTQHNLNSEELGKILRIIDVPFADFESKTNLIDEKLVGRRNPIAHGKKKVISLQDYHEADREVRLLLDIFQRKIEDCIQSSHFVGS